MRPTIRDVASKAGVSIATVSRALRDPQIVSPDDPGQGRPGGRRAGVRAEPPRPPAGRAPARRQRHRLPRPVRPLLRRGRPRLRGRRRRARPLGAASSRPTARGRAGDGHRPRRPHRRPGRPRPHGLRRGAEQPWPAAASRWCSLARTPLAGDRLPERREPRDRPGARGPPDLRGRRRASPSSATRPSSSDVAERLEGLAGGAAAAGRRRHRHGHARSSTSTSGIRVGRDAVLKSGRLPDAFACANDELALGLMTELRAGGVAVPDDVLVAGWDDVMAARYAGLTTVRQPMRELGATAARMLDELISGRREPRPRGARHRAHHPHQHAPSTTQERTRTMKEPLIIRSEPRPPVARAGRHRQPRADRAAGVTPARDGAEGQGEAIEEGKATGTIEVWAMGTEGEVLGDFAAAFRTRTPTPRSRSPPSRGTPRTTRSPTPSRPGRPPT